MTYARAIMRLLFKPVDIASLAIFRILFGLLMAWDSSRYLMLGWVESHYIEPAFQFKFIGFLWVKTMGSFGMHAVFGAMVGLGITIALGYFYRLSCVLFFLAHTYVFLTAAEYYLNHAYLISLFTLLMAFVPAHRALSLDVLRRPELYSGRIFAWPLVLLAGMVTVVFVFGAIAKMNADWFAGEPVRHWLADRAATSEIGWLLEREATIFFVVYAGCFFDLLVGPMLIWRRTRLLGLAGSLVFHLSNAYLFSIGVFPWFMLAATTLFFHPSWPRSIPLYGRDLDRLLDKVGARGRPRAERALELSAASKQRIALALGAFFAFEIAVPLRHHLYPGNVAWTEEGHYFSWRMKLRHKEGRIAFRITDSDTGESWHLDPRAQLGDRQVRKMLGRPDNILQYAHYLRDAYATQGRSVEVRADVFVGLNYRPERRFIDPNVDLAREPFRFLTAYPFIVPFEATPLPSPVKRLRPQLYIVARRVERRARGPRAENPETPGPLR